MFNSFVAGICLCTAINGFINGDIVWGFIGIIFCVVNVLGCMDTKY